MASNEGIQAFAQAIPKKSIDESFSEQSDSIRQYLAKKTAWISPTEEQFDALATLLKKRLDEGHGETILELGTGGETRCTLK